MGSSDPWIRVILGSGTVSKSQEVAKTREEDAKLALLQTELQAIQENIRSLDSIVFQIKGWCVTTSLAVAGFAAAYNRPSLLLVGAGAVIGFLIVNCQFKMIQRYFFDRNYAIDSELTAHGIMKFLKNEHGLKVVGTATLGSRRHGTSALRSYRQYFTDLLHEALRANTFSLYVFVLVCLGIEAAILLHGQFQSS
jgi:hypothetical protein